MIRRHIKKLYSSISSNDYKTLNTIEISRSRLLSNYSLFRKNTSLGIIPVLKANAYGHGISQAAEILNDTDCELIAVDGYFEASKIRDVTKKKILVLGYILPENFHLLDVSKCSFVIQDIEGLKRINDMNKPVNVHIEINTGMNRLGIDPDELGSFLNHIGRYSNINLEGVMTHLADADNEVDSSYSVSQVELFDKSVEQILSLGFNPKYIHIAQTAGSVKISSKYANSMRLGIGLYGLNPLSSKDKSYNNLSALKPVLSFTTTIVKKSNLIKGDRVSYNGIFTAPNDMTIGVLPLGYYEGIPRQLSNVGLVKHGDNFLPIVGRVCMNHIMISLEGQDLSVGDKLTVISNDVSDKNSVQQICKDHDLFNYSLVTCLSESTRRVITT